MGLSEIWTSCRKGERTAGGIGPPWVAGQRVQRVQRVQTVQTAPPVGLSLPTCCRYCRPLRNTRDECDHPERICTHGGLAGRPGDVTCFFGSSAKTEFDSCSLSLGPLLPLVSYPSVSSLRVVSSLPTCTVPESLTHASARRRSNAPRHVGDLSEHESQQYGSAEQDNASILSDERV